MYINEEAREEASTSYKSLHITSRHCQCPRLYKRRSQIASFLSLFLISFCYHYILQGLFLPISVFLHSSTIRTRNADNQGRPMFSRPVPLMINAKRMHNKGNVIRCEFGSRPVRSLSIVNVNMNPVPLLCNATLCRKIIWKRYEKKGRKKKGVETCHVDVAEWLGYDGGC